MMQNEKCVLSKAWDDRIGVAVMVEVMKRLHHEKIYPTLYVAGTVQEEVGLRGAKTVAQMVQPDLALAIDVTFSYDLPGGEQGDVRLGKWCRIMCDGWQCDWSYWFIKTIRKYLSKSPYCLSA